MHIRTDDEVYRVDAVWLGPPRATFPWRARYSAYGVGLIVMVVVMFVQRRLGIDLGFFSVAWALLITVAITRFVSRRINDERPLLEWLALFVHELRGPRVRRRPVGGALTTGHVAVRRDRPKLTGAPTAIALPRGSDRPAQRVVSRPADGDEAWGPPPRDDEAAPAASAVPDAAPAPAPAPSPTPAAEDEVEEKTPAAHVTPDVADVRPSHARARRGAGSGGTPAERRRRTRPARTPGTRAAGGDFGPPSSAEVGATRPPGTPTPTHRPAALPPVPDPRPGDDAMAAWTGSRARRDAVAAHRATGRKPDTESDPDRTQRRPARPRRRPGWPMSNEPAGSGSTAATDQPFGPGSRSRDAGRARRGDPAGEARGGDGAAPR
ncbi:hypothetical protein [Actinomycetospora lemnae]|uniref:PrgI family protein n=1 Tax=Actinomycetospora lemnae TaxID=3019891 RepID=A0ABT5SS67_9PSEU|nr:hypothetical protein [Actinomycetospora sp. DW7H6]MDD7965634.1 hypothetical protein [Actinomycetospora sp. DW7H6]